LTDVANFTAGRRPDGDIDPVFCYEHMLTVDRLVRKTMLGMSLNEVGTAKMQVFEIAEIYDQLSMRFGNSSGATDFFKRLLHGTHGPNLLRPRLATLPEPFATDLTRLTDAAYSAIVRYMVETVWVEKKVTATDVLVKDKAGSGETAMPHADFVAELMRAYRNAHHGYFTASDQQKRPSRFLFMVDGALPNELTVLPMLWLLAYLPDPSLVGWKHLPVGAF